MKNILKLFVLASILLVSSCQNDFEEIFDKNASERSQESVADVKKILKENKNGWIIHYFPNSNMSYGGYSVFVKFEEDNQVIITSDVDSRVINSSYNVIPETGTVLLFDTYNPIIHYFSEPGLDSGIGPADSGMGGDFQFVIKSADSKKIVMRGKDSNVLLEMHAIEENNFEALANTYQKSFKSFKEVESLSFYFITNDGTKHPVGVSSNTITDKNNANAPRMPFRITPNGLDFYDKVSFKGASFDQLLKKEATKEFPNGYYENKEGTIKFFYDNPTLNEYLTAYGLWYIKYEDLGSFSQAVWDVSNIFLDSEKLSLEDVHTISVGRSLKANNSTGINIELKDGSFAIFQYSIVPVANTVDEVEFKFTESLFGNNNNLLIKYWSSGLNLLAEAGFGNKTFKITGNGPIPTKMTLVDKANPDNKYIITKEVSRNPYVKKQ